MMNLIVNEGKMNVELLKGTLTQNSFIGFDMEEIVNTTTEELMTIRKSVKDYLTSTKLKKRNKNFVRVFHRINKELVKRGAITPVKKTRPIFKHIKSVSSTNLSNSITSDEVLSNSCMDGNIKHLKSLVKTINVQIPTFFNDKKDKIKFDQNSFSKCHSSKIKSIDNFYSNKINNDENNNPFSFDTIQYKPDFRDQELFFPQHNLDMEPDLKEMELKAIMFNQIVEDKYFNLDD